MFSIKFLVLFLLFYYFNIMFFGLTSPGNNYNAFLDEHLNYVAWLRWGLLHTSSFILNHIGFISIVSTTELLVVSHNKIQLIYSCLGLGVMSFFAAFVIAYPKKLKPKLWFLLAGLLGIQALNILRLMVLALYWNRSRARIVDHHLIFDVFIYIVIVIALFRWVNNTSTNQNAANRSVGI
jgi:exosortase/archaeosortase family protein